MSDDSDPVARAFIDMWARAGNGLPVRADDCVPATNSVWQQPERAVDLVYAEYLIRVETGDEPPASELFHRFPHLADLLRRQLMVHAELSTIDHHPQETLRTPPVSDAEPTAVGRYRVIARLGRGGQAIAYRGYDADLARDVVIKLGHSPATSEDRVLAEGRTLAALDHPGLARVLDCGLHLGRPFLVTEFIDGVPLGAATLERRAIRPLLTAIASALGAAHAKGVVHCDLKPGNVIVGRDGRPRLIDFGVARVFGPASSNASGIVSGTLGYMAPEQTLGDPATIDARTDVFGLGGLLYYLLTGHAPYQGGTTADLLERVRDGDWDQTKLGSFTDRRLSRVCRKALARNPNERYPSAAAFASDLPARFPWATVAVGVAACLGGGYWLARPTPSPIPAVAPAVSDAMLQVRVWDDDAGRYRDLEHALPLASGDRFRFEIDRPAGVSVSLFSATADGRVENLTNWPGTANAERASYPSDANQAVPLAPPAGTVVVLACGYRVGEPTAADVAAALGSEPWPVLPPSTTIRISHDEVRVHGSRGLTDPVPQHDPEGEVVQRLERARRRLANCALLAGVAFAHR